MGFELKKKEEKKNKKKQNQKENLTTNTESLFGLWFHSSSHWISIASSRRHGGKSRKLRAHILKIRQGDWGPN